MVLSVGCWRLSLPRPAAIWRATMDKVLTEAVRLRKLGFAIHWLQRASKIRMHYHKLGLNLFAVAVKG